MRRYDGKGAPGAAWAGGEYDAHAAGLSMGHGARATVERHPSLDRVAPY
jgi:hypothetical protein